MDIEDIENNIKRHDMFDPDRNLAIIIIWMVDFFMLLGIHTRYTIQGICRQKEM